MDNPRVNISFYTGLVKTQEEAQCPNLIDVGTCSLHVIYDAFKNGYKCTNWKIKNILKGSFQLLHDSPAHVADYSSVIEVDIFPLYFCATRWVEDKKVADRLPELWENLQKL